MLNLKGKSSLDSSMVPDIGRNGALFFDLDGTLAAITDDPRSVTLDSATCDALLTLSATLERAVAVISGRDVRDLSELVPIDLWRVGSHGLEICAPLQVPPDESVQEPPAELLTPLLAVLRGAPPGVRLEIKSGVVAVHYRSAPAFEAAALGAARNAVLACAGYVVEQGKMIVELKPRGVTKGAAVTQLMRLKPFMGRQPFVFGDDATDESAFAAAIAIGGESVKIGPGPTCAQHRIASSVEMTTWLEREAARFAKP